MEDKQRNTIGGSGEAAPRKRCRTREERGLPDEQARIDLAATYLEVQHARWPELAACGALPPMTDETAAGLAGEFQRRFLATESVDIDHVVLEGATLGWGYLRYSDENSNPRSPVQQLRNVLN